MLLSQHTEHTQHSAQTADQDLSCTKICLALSFPAAAGAEAATANQGLSLVGDYKVQ